MHFAAILVAFSLLSALLWGALFALFQEKTDLGRTLTGSAVWLLTIAGVAGDLALALLVVVAHEWSGLEAWLITAGVVCASGVGPATRNVLRMARNMQALTKWLEGN